MTAQIVRFFSLVFVGINLAPGLAHVLQMPHKMDLSGDNYLRVQQLYAGWSLLGVVVLGALISTLALTVLVRERLRQFGPRRLALADLLDGHVPGESADAQLDDVAGELDDAARALGILARDRGSLRPDRVYRSRTRCGGGRRPSPG